MTTPAASENTWICSLTTRSALTLSLSKRLAHTLCRQQTHSVTVAAILHSDPYCPHSPSRPPGSGCPDRRPHPELPSGEVSGGAPKPRREELPHLLPAAGVRGQLAADEAGAGHDQPTALPLPGEGVCLSKRDELLLLFFILFLLYSLALTLALLHQGNCPRVSTISDKSSWKAVSKGLTVIGFNEEEVEVRRLHADYNHTHSHSRPNTTRAHEPPTSCCFPLLPQELLKVVASVLHLGNTLFGEDEYGQTHFTTETPLTYLTEVRTTITVSALIPQLDVKT